MATTVEEHDDCGRLRLRCVMKDGVLHGPLEEFGPSGAPAMSAHFEQGKLHGPLAVYGTDGVLVQRSAYRHGVLDGAMETFVNGRRIAAQSMVDGVASGLSLSYDEAGQLSAQVPLLAGKPEGSAAFYHEGRPVRTATYRNGLLDGEAVDRDPQGGVVQRCMYRANLLHGPVRRYWPDGALMEQVQYRDGVPLGEPQRFDQRGRRIGNQEAAPALMDRIKQLLRGQ